MPYRFFEHTADVGLEVSAPTLAALFSEALRGMTDVITDVRTVDSRLERQIEVTAESLDLLLLELLGEALFHFEVDCELYSSARAELVESDGGWSLSCVAEGERLDPQRHPMRVMIKAATYHRLQVARAADGWRARVIFDI